MCDWLLTVGLTLVFRSDLHQHRLQRIVPAIAGQCHNLIHHLHAFHHLSEDRVHAVQAAGVFHDDVKLRPAVGNVSGGVFIAWDFGHGDSSTTVRPITRFGRETKPRSSGPMKVPLRVFTHGVTTLDEKLGNDPVECRPIEKFQPNEIEEIFHVSGRIVRIEADFNIPKLGGDDGFRIFLFKLQGRWCRHNLGTLARGCKVHQASSAFQRK